MRRLREWLAQRLLSRLAAGAAVLITDHSGGAGQRLPVAAGWTVGVAS